MMYMNAKSNPYTFQQKHYGVNHTNTKHLPVACEIRPHARHAFHLKIFRIGNLEHRCDRRRHKQVQQVIVVNRTCGLYNIRLIHIYIHTQMVG